PALAPIVFDRKHRRLITDQLANKAYRLEEKEATLQQAEQTIEAGEARYRRIVDNILDAVITITVEGIITHWNARATEIFGWRSEEAIGRNLTGLVIPTANRELHDQWMRHACAGGQEFTTSQRMEIQTRHREWREFPTEWMIVPHRAG